LLVQGLGADMGKSGARYSNIDPALIGEDGWVPRA
jgi:hypothetical protein